MINVISPEQLVFGLDIGTRSIVGTVGYREKGGFCVVAQHIHEHETRAMMDGQIHDIGKVAETIRIVKDELEKQTGQKLTQVCIAAAGRVLKTVQVTAEYEFHAETMVNDDHLRSLDLMGVEKAYAALRDELHDHSKNFYCIGYTVINYSLNGYTMMKLNGHKANKIATQLLATFLPDEVINGLYTAVEAAGLQVASLTLEPIAAISVAIPEKFRLLNIAMVDVGAGTSDISITKDGSIIAYGMIPEAGDEITEAIAQKYLVEFQVAENVKTACLKKKKVSFKDVMGTTHKLETVQIHEVVSETLDKITKSISDKIIELNGGKSVSAVFVVGGGGKFPGFVTRIADHLNLAPERVALRGEDVLKEITFLQENAKRDSLMVTPIGICLHYYEQSNNFIFVTVNGERIKLFDNNKLTISDAAIQLGIPNEKIFPGRGKSIHFTVNGIERELKGGLGEAAQVRLNGETVGITHSISHNDKIEIIESTSGKNADCEIKKLKEYKTQISFQVNGSKVQYPKFVFANGRQVSEFYTIKNDDKIEILDYYTIKQLLEFMDIEFYGELSVNNQTATMEQKIYDNDSIRFKLNSYQISSEFLKDKKSEEETIQIQSLQETAPVIVKSNYELPPRQSYDDWNLPLSFRIPVIEQTLSDKPRKGDPNIETGNTGTNKETTIEKKEEPAVAVTLTEDCNTVHEIFVTVNSQVVKMSGKSKYIFVDVFDYYSFDLSKMGGSELVTVINGERAEFTALLNDNDIVEIYWK